MTDTGSPAPPLAGGVVIRRAAHSDAATLHAIAAATFGLACPPDTAKADIDAFIATNLSIQAFGHYLLDPARTLFVAEQDGAGIGYTMLIAEDPTDPDVSSVVRSRPTVELSKCYVLPGHHGGVVAAALVSASLDEAGWRGAKSIWLGVNQQNSRANRFYEKSGFVTVGTKRFRLGDRLEEDFVKELVF